MRVVLTTILSVGLLFCVGCSAEQKEAQPTIEIEYQEAEEISDNQIPEAEISGKKVLYASNYTIFNMLNILTEGLSDKYEVKMIETPGTDICTMAMTDELKAELIKADTIVFMNCEKEQWLNDSICNGDIVGIKAVDIGSLITERDKVMAELGQEIAGEVTVGEYGLIEADASEKIMDPQNIDYIVDILSVIISASDKDSEARMTANKDAFIEEMEAYKNKVLAFQSSAEESLIVVNKQKIRYLAAKYDFEVLEFEESFIEESEDNSIKVGYFTNEEYETIKNIENVQPVRLYDMVNCSEADIDGCIELLDMVEANIEAIDSSIIPRGLDVEKITE